MSTISTPAPIPSNPNPFLGFLQREKRGFIKKRAIEEWDEAKKKKRSQQSKAPQHRSRVSCPHRICHNNNLLSRVLQNMCSVSVTSYSIISYSYPPMIVVSMGANYSGETCPPVLLVHMGAILKGGPLLYVRLQTMTLKLSCLYLNFCQVKILSCCS